MTNVLIDNSAYLQKTIADWEKTQIHSLKRQLSKEYRDEKKTMQQSFDEYEKHLQSQFDSKEKQLVQKYDSLIHMRKKSHDLTQFSQLYKQVIDECMLLLQKKSNKTDMYFSQMSQQLVTQFGKGKLSVPKHVTVKGAKSTLTELAVQLVVGSQTYELTVQEVIEQSQDIIRGVLRD